LNSDVKIAVVMDSNTFSCTKYQWPELSNRDWHYGWCKLTTFVLILY